MFSKIKKFFFISKDRLYIKQIKQLIYPLMKQSVAITELIDGLYFWEIVDRTINVANKIKFNYLIYHILFRIYNYL